MSAETTGETDETGTEVGSVEPGGGASVDAGPTGVTGLERQVSALAAVMSDPDGHGPDPVVAVLQVMAAALPGVDGATLTRTRAHRPYTAAVSDERAALWDRWQLRAKQGPTLDALTGRAPVPAGDLAAASRWPQLHGAPVPRTPGWSAPRSVYCFPLPHAGPTAAVLTLYSTRRHVLARVDSRQLAVLVGMVDLVLAGLAQHTRAGNLDRAMPSNQRIGTAVGILIGLHHYTEQEALDALAVASQALNRKVADLADDIVLSGAMPDLPHGHHTGTIR